MDESTLLTHVRADFTLSRMTMQSQQEKSYSGSESEILSEMKQIRALTASLLASSASYFLISWQKPSRFFATTVEYFLEYFLENFKIFHCVMSTFSGAKVQQEKLSQFTKNLRKNPRTNPRKLQKFSHRETHLQYDKNEKNLTI